MPTSDVFDPCGLARRIRAGFGRVARLCRAKTYENSRYEIFRKFFLVSPDEVW